MISWRSARAGGVLILLVILAGCADTLFASLEDRGEVALVIQSQDTNAVIPGATITLQLEYKDEFTEALTSIDITIAPVLDWSEIVYQTALIPDGRSEDRSALVVDVPEELPPGVYRITATGWRGSTEVVSKDWQAFVTPIPLRIQQLSLVPIRPVVNSQSLALAVLEVPQGQRPWLHWRVGDTYLSSGYLEDGLDQVTLNLGPERGAYPVRLEVFPWGPEEGVQFNQNTVAPINVTAEVIVRGQSDPGALAPPNESLLWYPLTGYLRATVVRDPLLTEQNLFPRGAPDAQLPPGASLHYRGGILGYLIPRDEHFAVPLPLIVADQRATRMTATFVFPEESENPLYLSLEQGDVITPLALLNSGNLTIGNEDKDGETITEDLADPDTSSQEIHSEEPAHPADTALLVSGMAFQIELYFTQAEESDLVTLAYTLRRGTQTVSEGTVASEILPSVETMLRVSGSGSRSALVSSVAISWPSAVEMDEAPDSITERADATESDSEAEDDAADSTTTTAGEETDSESREPGVPEVSTGDSSPVETAERGS